jgi:hypothetical protein
MRAVSFVALLVACILPSATSGEGGDAGVPAEQEGPTRRNGLRIYVYPMDEPLDLNEEILRQNAGWVHNEWNAHNQYITEYVLHQNLLRSAVRTSSPEEADIFFLPLYVRIGIYNATLLAQLQRQALATLQGSPWFQRYRGRDHLVVWSSQRPVHDLLGTKLHTLLRLHCTFLVVDAADSRAGRLQVRSRDIVIPAYLPAKQLTVDRGIFSHRTLVRGEQDRRTTRILFAGEEAQSSVRRAIVEALRGLPGVEIIGPKARARQDSDPKSEAALEFARVCQQTAEAMERSMFCICARGSSATTRTLWQALAHGCIPILVSDSWTQFPFPLSVDITSTFVRVQERSVPHIHEMVSAISPSDITQMQTAIAQEAPKLVYHHPEAVPGDAFHQILAQLRERVVTWRERLAGSGHVDGPEEQDATRPRPPPREETEI